MKSNSDELIQKGYDAIDSERKGHFTLEDFLSFTKDVIDDENAKKIFKSADIKKKGEIKFGKSGFNYIF